MRQRLDYGQEVFDPMIELGHQHLLMVFCALPLIDVDGHAQKAVWRADRVEEAPPTCKHPLLGTFRLNDPVLSS